MTVGNDNSFGENPSDKWAKRFQVGGPLAGSLFGPIGALIGTALGEYLSTTLPNQRADRIASFLNYLRSKLSEAFIERILTIPDRVTLLEEGIYAAGLTPYSEKLERIARFIAHGLSVEDFNLDKESFLLKIVRDLTEVDVIILKYYNLRDGYVEEDIKSYEQKYSEIFPNENDTDRKSQFIIKSNLDSRNSHLAALGLLIILPNNLYRPSPGGLGLTDADSSLRYELAKLNDMVQGLEKPRYGISFLGDDVLARILTDVSTEA